MAQTYAAPAAVDDGHSHARGRFGLTLGSVGVVYGDIGTSPIYAMKEAVTAARDHGMAGDLAVLGVLSLILWALILIVTLKYVLVLLHADNNGEGGTFALMALGQSVAKRSAPVLMVLGIVGVSFFYGDALITPAVSVLGAVEGLKLHAPALERFVVPITIAILLILFAMQARGTHTVARFFGPIMVVWFLLLAVGGLTHIVDDPRVFAAVNPLYGMQFLATQGLKGLLILGLVFLAVTGAEALYADLGHFGRVPIQTAWFALVLPSLALNYFGQGALILAHPEALENPFYKLYPQWALFPMIVFTTLAAMIASQAVITGAFSLTRQAIQLGLLPRLTIRHTSESMAGQIYLPQVNLLLAIGVVLVVVLFRNTSNLASAYGISVTAAMVVDSAMALFVIWRYWGWALWKACALIVPLLLIEQTFLAANMLKLVEGGWFPLMIGGLICIVMMTWQKGSQQVSRAMRKDEADLDWLTRKLEAKPPHRVPGTAIFLTSEPNYAPTALMHNLKHNRVLHERNIILAIKTEDKPRIPRHERVVIEKVSDTFTTVIARYGFMETPSVPKILEHCRRKDLNLDIGATSFFLSRRSLKASGKSPLSAWQRRLFVHLAKRAEDATEYFKIPTDRVVEIGTQLQI